MRILVPIALDRGLDSRISPHFGRAPLHLVVDTASGERELYPNDRTRPGAGGCTRILARVGAPPSVVLVQGIGAGALAQLRGAGARVFAAGRGTVADAVAALEAGTLEELTDRANCGHDHATRKT